MKFRFFVLLMLGLPALCTQSGYAQDSLNINMIGRLDFLNNAYNLVPEGNLLYVAAGTSGLRILDVSDPENPFEIGSFLTYGDAWDLKIVGDYAFVANDGMTVLDISDPTHPVMVDSLSYGSLSTDARCIAIQGDYAFVSGYQDLTVVNISDPQAIFVDTTFYAVGSEAYDIAIYGSYLYIGSSSWTIKIYDISIPDRPVWVGTCPGMGYFNGYQIVGDKLYVTSESGFFIVSLANPTQPVIMSHFDVIEFNDVTVSGSLAYLAAGDLGLHVMNVANPYAPFELGYISDPDVYAYRIAHSNTMVYVGSYNWYIHTYDSGIHIYDVSSPFFPEEIGSYNTVGFCNQVTVKNGYTYMAGGSGGFVILNTTDPSHLVVESQLNQFGSVTKTLAPGSLAFAMADSYLVKINVTIPENPNVVDFCTEGSTIKDFAIQGQYAYAATYPGDLEIYKVFPNDVFPITGQPTLSFISRCNLTNNVTNIAVDSTRAYLRFYASANDGIYVVDISNPFNPTLISTYSPGSLRLGVLAVYGNYVYIPNTTTGVLCVVDFQNPTAPILTPLISGLDYVTNISIQDNRLLVSCNYLGIYLFEINSPTNLSLLGMYNTPFHAKAAAMQGDTLYVSDYEAFEVFRYLPQLPPGGITADKNSASTRNSSFDILNCSPNPFNPTTTIRFGLPVASCVTLEVFDISGRNVTLSRSGTTPTTVFYPAGYHEITFDGSKLASGIYICRIEAGDFTASQKLVLLK